MKVETFKSIILFLLVMLSFLLSFLLWSYQPRYDSVYDPSDIGDIDIDVGGDQLSMSELIRPNKIIIHHDYDVFGFKKATDMQSFYEEMSNWVVYDYEVNNYESTVVEGRTIDITFPYNLPINYIRSIFKLESKDVLPNWSFNTISIGLNADNHSLDVTVVSANKTNQLTASIDKTENYERVVQLMNQTKGLQSLMPFELTDKTIYIPRDAFSLPRKTLVANELNPNLFVNALFRNPSLVTQNRLEAIFTDGQRGMRILNDGKTMEYTNPVESSVMEQNELELLSWSVDRINDHNGWTNMYYLDRIHHAKNEVVYRMALDGYPIYDFYNISLLSQEWRDQNLFQYERTLVRLGNTLSSVSTELMSGDDVRRFIETQQINKEEIKDITIGYYLSTVDKHSFLLEPSWFIVYEDQWRRVTRQDLQHSLTN